MGLLHYPRGITNPNYPGFQHLAHTLAEHFIDQQFDQSYQSDSDISDDCTSDSFPERQISGIKTLSDGNNNDSPEFEESSLTDLNRNESRMSSNKNRINLMSRASFEESKSNTFAKIKRSKSEEFEVKYFNSREENFSENAMDFDEDSDLELNANDINYDCETLSVNELQWCEIEKLKDHISLLTPDILIEHKSCRKPLKMESTFDASVTDEETKESFENRDYGPDLIKHIIIDENISTTPLPIDGDEKMENEEAIESFRNVNRSVPLSIESASSTVDIIGDFGKEMQKEISMIVSGYLDTTNEMCSLEPLSDESQSVAASEDFVGDGNMFAVNPESSSKVSSITSLSGFWRSLCDRPSLKSSKNRQSLSGK